MSDADDLKARIAALRTQLRDVHGVQGKSLAQVRARAKRHLPRPLNAALAQLFAAEADLGHPKIERMIDYDTLRAHHDRIAAHLSAIDLADIRRGRMLAMAGMASLYVILGVAGFVTWMVLAGHL